MERRYADSAADLYAVHPRLGALGGSAAQREVIEKTLLHVLLIAGWLDEAQRVLASRLDRKVDRSVVSPASQGFPSGYMWNTPRHECPTRTSRPRRPSSRGQRALSYLLIGRDRRLT